MKKFGGFIFLLYICITEQNKRTKQNNNYYFMENTNLKKGDVIAINWGGTKMLAIFEKFDTKFGNQNRLYIYAEMNMCSKELYFKPDDCDFSYELRDITYRLADDDEKNTLYNAIGKHFTEEYDKDWYNHFTDSSYFDIQDYLLDVFQIKVIEYDDDLIYPDFINEIHNYIWDGLCNALGTPNEVEKEPEMVNKQEFIEKLEKWITANTDWNDEYVWDGRNPNYGLWSELKKYLEE